MTFGRSATLSLAFAAVLYGSFTAARLHGQAARRRCGSKRPGAKHPAARMREGSPRTFVPNNAVIMHDEAVALMTKLMADRGIKHTTSECTLRGFTCAEADVDPKTATPAEIQRIRALQVGPQVQGIAGGLAAKEK